MEPLWGYLMIFVFFIDMYALTGKGMNVIPSKKSDFNYSYSKIFSDSIFLYSLRYDSFLTLNLPKSMYSLERSIP